MCVCVEMEQSVGDGCDSAASSVVDADSIHQQSSLHCDDDVLASAENENNMNVESENSSAAAAGTADVVENSESVADLQVEDKQDRSGAVMTDETCIADSLSVDDMSAGATRDIRETKLTKDHAVLSSCSAMIIDVQDDEFSDEEMEDENVICEPSLQPWSSNPSIEQSELQQLGMKSADDKSKESQPTIRVIRLNRSCPQQLRENVDTAESRHGGTIVSGQKRSQRPNYDSDVLPQKMNSTVVAGSNQESIGLKQSKLDKSSKLSQSSQKFSAAENLVPTRSRSGKMSAVNLRPKLSPDSVSVTCSESVSDECRKVRIVPLRPVLEDQRADENQESCGSSESDSLSKTQLEILELEMRARAIKAMIRAQEEMELLESVEKKRRSSEVMDVSKATGQQKAALQHSLTRSTNASDRPPSASTMRSRGELRSLQSVIGRNIIKRAQHVARRQRRMTAGEGRFQQQKQFAELEQRRLSQAALEPSWKTVRLQPDARWRPVRYVVASQASPRVVRLRSARVGALQRRIEVRRSLHSSRDDQRRVLVSSDRRSVRMSSSSRPY